MPAAADSLSAFLNFTRGIRETGMRCPEELASVDTKALTMQLDTLAGCALMTTPGNGVTCADIDAAVKPLHHATREIIDAIRCASPAKAERASRHADDVDHAVYLLVTRLDRPATLARLLAAAKDRQQKIDLAGRNDNDASLAGAADWLRSAWPILVTDPMPPCLRDEWLCRVPLMEGERLQGLHPVDLFNAYSQYIGRLAEQAGLTDVAPPAPAPAKQTGEQPAAPDPPGGWSEPKAPKEWERVFKMKWRRIKRLQIRMKCLGTKAYQVAVADVPAPSGPPQKGPPK